MQRRRLQNYVSFQRFVGSFASTHTIALSQSTISNQLEWKYKYFYGNLLQNVATSMGCCSRNRENISVALGVHITSHHLSSQVQVVQ